MRVSPAAESIETARTAYGLCSRLKIQLRLMTFVVRDRQMYPTGAGYDAENLVANQWRAQATEGQSQIIAALPPDPPVTAGHRRRQDLESRLRIRCRRNGEIIAVGSEQSRAAAAGLPRLERGEDRAAGDDPLPDPAAARGRLKKILRRRRALLVWPSE